MRLGKLNNEQLERLVLSKYSKTREESLGTPQVGEDCAALNLGGDLTILSTDPVTAATNHLGRLSVHVNCNDAAAAGAEPVGLMVTLLAPPDATEQEIESIAQELSDAAHEVGVDILGGHTEVTDSVTRFITNTTVVARMPAENRLLGMQPGNDIVLTKWAGLEGSMLIAADFKERLKILNAQEFKELASWIKHLSVVPEGRYAARHGATAMHDVTEGGVLGAAWEMCHTTGVGMELNEIPVHPITVDLCAELGLDPLRLLSSGCMLIACEDGEAMTKGLKALNIAAAVIGKAGGKTLRLNGKEVTPPEADELYRLF
ncbi:AIR synthase family protein [Eubacteriales bacterium OttesenSCG-928-K08]|nr:AIR synthase family protein [Eubacteriales bacterium OttesenSCG-928-K08]